MTRKWRPSLSLVLAGGLCGTLALSLVGLVAFRYLGPEIGFRNAAAVLAVAITGATSVLGWLLVRLLLRPIQALENFASHAATTPTETRPPPDHFGTRELRSTAQRVIDMAHILRNRETTIRSFSDHATHELKTPVAAIRAATELLCDGETLSPEDRKLVTMIDAAGRQIERQLSTMQQIVRAREIRHDGETDLAALSETLQQGFPQLDIMLTGTQITIPLSQQGMTIVLGHLLENSVAHGSTRVQIAVSRRNDQTQITVHDNGSGISDGNAARIFEPFFTTKRDQGGTGMGLPIVRNTLRVHGGEIAVASPPHGAAFVIRFGSFAPL